MSSITAASATSPQVKLALTLIESYCRHDMDAVLATLSEDFKQNVLPKSLGRPTQGKEDWVAHLAKYNGLMPDHQVVIHDVNEGTGKVWLYASSTGTFITGDAYSNEYVFMLSIRETEGKHEIFEFKEFVDSLAGKRLMEIVAKYHASQKASTV